MNEQKPAHSKMRRLDSVVFVWGGTYYTFKKSNISIVEVNEDGIEVTSANGTCNLFNHNDINDTALRTLGFTGASFYADVKSRYGPNGRKGVFCIEGDWGGEYRGSVKGLLEYAHGSDGMPYKFCKVKTFQDFKERLSEWASQSNGVYPILYLAFHGDSGLVSLGLEGKPNITLEQLAELLQDRCAGKVVYFGSCATLDVTKERGDEFLEATGAFAIFGYRTYVDWNQSGFTDMLALGQMQTQALSPHGLEKIKREIQRYAGPRDHLRFTAFVRASVEAQQS